LRWLTLGNDFDAAEVDRDIISQRLQEDVAETKGKVYKHIATLLSAISPAKQIQLINPVTCVTQYGTSFYVGCKNGVIEKWDMKDVQHCVRLKHIKREKNKKIFTAHTDDILSMAISGDGKLLATGGLDKRICIWETTTMKHVKSFTQHRGAVMVIHHAQQI
jgi:ribosomal RNA-processing protein 9